MRLKGEVLLSELGSLEHCRCQDLQVFGGPTIVESTIKRWSEEQILYANNRFPLIMNDVPPPPPFPVIINNPGGQKLFIIRGAYSLKGFSRAAFRILVKQIKIELKSR